MSRLLHARIVSGVAFVLSGCAWHRGGPVAEDPLAAGIVAAQAAWERRAEPDGLAAAIAAWEALHAQAPTDPRVLAALAHAHWLAGLVAPTEDEALDELETGRGYGGDCLLTFPTFADGLGGEGYRVTAGTVSGLDAAAVPCLTWAAANAYTLVERRGRGAALEVEQARPLSDRAWALAPDGEDGMVAWAYAMSVVLDQDPARAAKRSAAMPEAEAALRRAMSLAPGNHLFVAALVAYVPEVEPALARQLIGPPSEKWALESKGAVLRPGSPER